MTAEKRTVEFGLSLGSNLGDRLANLARARDRIAALPGVRLLARSAAYETSPVDVRPEFGHLMFINAVLVVASDAAPEALSDAVHRIEDEFGRLRGPDRNRPRPIDIDLIYAGGRRLSTPRLTLPHPRWSERRFVVQPLAEVRPDLRLPGEDRPVRDVLAALPAAAEKVTVFAREW